MNSINTDVLVIGAGPAGCAAASKLNQLGFSSIVLEKCEFPRFVIGESLLPKCLDHLKEIGAFDIMEKANFKYKDGARFIKGEEICDFNFAEKSVEGWDFTWQVKRTEFDTLLADFVKSQNIPVKYKSTVTAVDITDNGSTVTYEQNGESHKVHAKFVVDASGYGRVLPRLLDLIKSSSLDPKSAFFAHVKSEQLWDWIDNNKVNYVIGEKASYVWMIPFSDKTISIGLVADMDNFPEVGNEEKLLNMFMEMPPLNNHIDDISFVRSPELIRGFSTSISQYFGKGYVLVGNTTEFLDPVFSSGVTIAMESGILAANLVAKELGGEAVDWKVEYEDAMKVGISAFQGFVESWYNNDLIKIFFNDEKPEVFRRYICSILAGYAWDQENPLVMKHKRALKTMAKLTNT